jgi:hypothetical protein
MNLSPNIRSFLYALITILSPTVAYLGSQKVLSDFWVGLFSVIVSAVTALAFSKVTPDV